MNDSIVTREKDKKQLPTLKQIQQAVDAFLLLTLFHDMAVAVSGSTTAILWSRNQACWWQSQLKCWIG